MNPFELETPTFRVRIARPTPFGHAQLEREWVTDGKGAIAALEEEGGEGLAVVVEMEGWTDDLPPFLADLKRSGSALVIG